MKKIDKSTQEWASQTQIYLRVLQRDARSATNQTTHNERHKPLQLHLVARGPTGMSHEAQKMARQHAVQLTFDGLNISLNVGFVHGRVALVLVEPVGFGGP